MPVLHPVAATRALHGPLAHGDDGGIALLQLQQAGVLDRQKAVLLGHFSNWKPSPLDRGYTLKSAVAQLRSVCKVPILGGLPFGHVQPKVCLPVGARVTLAVQGRDAFIGW